MTLSCQFVIGVIINAKELVYRNLIQWLHSSHIPFIIAHVMKIGILEIIIAMKGWLKRPSHSKWCSTLWLIILYRPNTRCFCNEEYFYSDTPAITATCAACSSPSASQRITLTNVITVATARCRDVVDRSNTSLLFHGVRYNHQSTFPNCNNPSRDLLRERFIYLWAVRPIHILPMFP